MWYNDYDREERAEYETKMESVAGCFSGVIGDDGIGYSDMGWYWSNTLYTDEENAETNAMLLIFGEQGANCVPTVRYGGQPIRPVLIK